MNSVDLSSPPPSSFVPNNMVLFWKSAALICFSFLWAAVAIRISHFLKLRRHHNSMLLPPGSLGWPYIGETLKMYKENPNSFFSSRQKRHGDVFKTHILGCPCVMTSSPEAALLILVSQAHKFKPTYPPSKERLIGSEAIFFHEGSYHSKLKKMIRASFQPSALRGMVSEIENLVVRTLPSWNNSNIITLHEMKKFSFEVALKTVFGKQQIREVETIKELYHTLEKGYNSMPLNLPGTLFHESMKARKKLDETLKRVIHVRRLDGSLHDGGLLGKLMEADDDKHEHLTDSQISDNIIGVIFAAHDTTASVLTWILKYLYDHQDVLNLVTKEQEDIRRILVKENRRLTWDDTRCMAFTSKVIQETLRLASIISFTFREAVEDIELEGYVIPKGWKVLPLFRIIHHSEDFFPLPEMFNPYRFEVPPKPHTYLPFGSGVHNCPGNELAKLEILVLLHHLTTTYKWKVAEDNDGIQYRPFPVPTNGLPINVSSRNIPCYQQL